MTRPGPAAIPPGEYPGGVVIHIYDVPSGVLLSTSHLGPHDDLDADAERAADQVARLRSDGHAVCMVGFDGDTGTRYTPRDWLDWLVGT